MAPAPNGGSRYFGLSTTEGFGALSRLELPPPPPASPMWSAQLGQRPPLSPPVREPQGATLLIDQATRSNLELVRTLSGERRGSLLAAIDRSVTAAGSRLLAQRLAAPLTDAGAIGRRHDAVAFFVASRGTREMRERLKAAPDLARSLARWSAAAARATSPPCATASPRLRTSRPSWKSSSLPPSLRRPCSRCADPILRSRPSSPRRWPTNCPISSATAASRAGYDAALDEARALRDESRRVIAALQAALCRHDSGACAENRHNNVLGYFVEVTAQHGDKLMAPPLNATFIHRQTLAGQVRFTTTELGELEAKIANAADRALGIELESFDKLAAIVTAASAAIKDAAARLPSSMSPPPGAIGGRTPLRAAGDRRLTRFHRRGWTPSGGGAGSRRRRRAVRRQ